MRRLANIPGITFALFLAWKVGLLLFTAQPVPSNDSFFYDGPVVNYLLHGRYSNPSLAMVLPISGNEVFCAYPPLHQFVLLGWMKPFGTSALAAMWLQVLLVSAYALVVWRILRQLQVPAVAINFAGLFLFGLTFHDRPDTLAHVMGVLAVLATIRGWPGPAAVFLVLAFGTSLQIGATYALWVAQLVVAGVWLRQIKFPWAAAVAFLGTLGGLVALVKFGYPHLWSGFQEHVAITPSVTGWRVPRVDELLKVVRTTPGIFLVTIGLGWAIATGMISRDNLTSSPQMVVALCGTSTALAVIAGCLLILTPNTVHVANYLQPPIVGCFLAAALGRFGGMNFRKAHWVAFSAAVLLVSIRAVGLTTWGVVCARDVGYPQAMSRVRNELDVVSPSSKVLVSAAFLYEAARYTNFTWLHSDWPAIPASGPWEAKALMKLQPAKLLLTQFDYYRRYQNVLNELRAASPRVEVRVINAAHVQPPDARPSLQKVLQHLSWAPVVVDFTWPEAVK
jgi:hypothetical protein